MLNNLGNISIFFISSGLFFILVFTVTKLWRSKKAMPSDPIDINLLLCGLFLVVVPVSFHYML